MYDYQVAISYDHPNDGHQTEKLRVQATTITAAVHIALRRFFGEKKETRHLRAQRAARAANAAVSITAVRFPPPTPSADSRPGAE